MNCQTDAALPIPPTAAASRRKAPIFVLYLLDAFVLGGCAAMLAVRQVIMDIMDRIQAASAAGQIDSLRAANAGGEYLNLLDHLLPYFVAYGLAVLVLALITLGVWFWRALGTMRKS